MKNNQEFDYIILGAGSAGCVLANELSQDSGNKVLIVEAGGMDNHWLIHAPAGVYSVFKDEKLNWNYESEPEAELHHRKITLPRGKVVGGSSSINSMVYMRGHPHDYDRWSNRYDLPNWSYAHCLPYFKQCENSDRGENDFRGGGGRLGVSRAKLANPLFDAFLCAGEQSGQGTTDDPNGYQPEGLARLDSTIKNGRRSSASVAHLRPALARANLTLLTHALVEKIHVSHGKATGVQINFQKQSLNIHCAKEVIVCAGAIKSPQLLMLSGIGPAQHLAEFDIDCVHHLPGVGQNLQDHLSISIIHSSRKPVTYHKVGNPLYKLMLGMQWLCTRKGFVASNIWEAGGHIRGHVYGDAETPEFANLPHANLPHANLQYHFAPIHAQYEGAKVRLFQGFTTQIDQLRPRSRGEIKLNGNHPAHPPAAHFNYISDPFDLGEMIDAVKRARELIGQKAFDEFRGTEIAPGAEVKTDQQIAEFIRQTATTDYHPSCTCKMGNENDEMAVVNAEMQVHGVDRLRVIDASVMPDIVSGNLNAPTQMIALKAATHILGRNPPPPFRPKFAFDM